MSLDLEKAQCLTSTLEKVEAILRTLFVVAEGCHNYEHFWRVYNMALRLHNHEGGDLIVIGAGAYIHDVHRLIEIEHGSFCPPVESLSVVESVLRQVNAFTDEQITAISHCVEYHEEYGFGVGGKKATDIETLIIQDADNLDAIGAIGLARCFLYDGHQGVPIYLPGMRALHHDEGIIVGEFEESERNLSSVHHIHQKLLRLRDNMHTATAKQIAQHRHDFMERFLAELDAEVKAAF